MSNKMTEYQIQFKENIKKLVNQNRLAEAKELITQYEGIVQDDIDLYSIKGVIAIMEGDMAGAKEILKEGLALEPLGQDLLFNMAYLYKVRKRYIKAYRYYNKLLSIASDDIQEEVDIAIKSLEKNKKVQEYIKRKKVLFVAHIFPPVGGSGVFRSLKFVKYLRNYGWEPIVVTVGTTQYPLKDVTMLSQIPEDIKIIRIDEKINIDMDDINKLIQIYGDLVNNKELMKIYIRELSASGESKNQLLHLPDPYIHWAMEVLKKIDDKVNHHEIDLIYTTSGPYSAHSIGYYLKDRYNKSWVADYRDEWTNNPYANYDKDSIAYKIQFAMEENFLHKADKIITTTPRASDNYRRIFSLPQKKVVTITNGYDEEDFEGLSNTYKKNEKFTIMHNGLLYLIRTPVTFLKAVSNLIRKRLVSKDSIHIIFTWTDNDKRWEDFAENLGLGSCVEFIGYLSHKESLKKAKQSDMLLLIVGPGEQNDAIYPGKVFEYLRMGKPILSLSPNNSVVDELITKTRAGYNVDYDDVYQMEKVLFKLYKNWLKDQFKTHKIINDIEKFERRTLTKKLANTFEETLYHSTHGKDKNNRDKIDVIYNKSKGTNNNTTRKK